MKRLAVRLLAIGSIVGVGGFAVVHVQHWRERANAAESDRAAAAAANHPAPTPIPFADDSRDGTDSRALPGTTRGGRSGGLIAQMRAEDAQSPDGAEPSADESAPAGRDPFRRSMMPEREERQVAARDNDFRDRASDPAADPGDARARDNPIRRDDSYRTPDGAAERLAAVPAQEPAEDRRFAARQEQPADPRDNQPQELAAAPRQSAIAEDPRDAGNQAPAENLIPDANSFAPIATGAESQGDAFAPPPKRDTATLEGTGRPGGQHLEGSQSPSLTIQKIAPKEIQVGKPATFTIKVRNTGSVIAQGVEVHDEIPQGTQLVSTTPRANRGPNGELIFELGVIKPKEEALAQVQLMPTTEGEIGSVATVHFRADASARTIVTRPLLTLKVTAPKKVMIGEEVGFKIKVSNPGSGVASGIVLSETVPAGLKHSSGSDLEFEVGTLKPGESRELELSMTAVRAGQVSNVLSARSDSSLRAESKTDVEILAPGLKVAMTGAKRRYLERKATYNVQVSNPGTASAKDVELIAVVPKGMKFIEANNSGQYDAATRSVYWKLEELPPRETGAVALTLLPTEAGELKLEIRGKAQQGLADHQEESISVEGLAAVVFDLSDVNDPIEVGGDTTYEIHVVNQGTKAASNVRVVAVLPAEMKALAADGPSRHVVDGQRILFDPLAQLAPKADTTYTVKAQGLKAGDMRVRVQIVTDELSTPITKEESTRVYSDE